MSVEESESGHRAAGAIAVFILAALLGAAVWAGWLGWDSEYYYDPEVGAQQGPYRPAQVVGCALTFGVVTLLLALRWRAKLVATGMTLGFWAVWTFDASEDETGLFMVGSVMLLVGLTVGSAICARLGSALARRLWGS